MLFVLACIYVPVNFIQFFCRGERGDLLQSKTESGPSDGRQNRERSAQGETPGYRESGGGPPKGQRGGELINQAPERVNYWLMSQMEALQRG